MLSSSLPEKKKAQLGLEKNISLLSLIRATAVKMGSFLHGTMFFCHKYVVISLHLQTAHHFLYWVAFHHQLGTGKLKYYSIQIISNFSTCLYRAVNRSPPVTLASVFTFSIQFSINFLRCWQGELVEHSRASLVGDYFLYSSWPKCVIQGWYCNKKLDASHSLWSKS